MEKLIIISRINEEKKVYIKIKAVYDSVKLIDKLLKEIDSEFIIDEFNQSASLLNYEEWKDQWIPCVSKDIGVDVIFGDRAVHLIFWKFKNLNSLNKILDKYIKWTKEKAK